MGLHKVGTWEAKSGLLVCAPIQMTSCLFAPPERPQLNLLILTTLKVDCSHQNLRALLEFQHPEAKSLLNFEFP